jgi:hypothetical protein
MALGNGNPKEGDKGSNFFWELKVLQGLEAIAEAIEAGGGGGGGGGGITALTGDVTAGPGSGSVIATIGALKVTTAKIANNAVTFGKMELITNRTFLGNDDPTTGAPNEGAVRELSLANIPYFSSAITGTANNANFLRGDGTWITPASFTLQNSRTNLTPRSFVNFEGSLTAVDEGATENRVTITGPTSNNGIETINTLFKLGGTVFPAANPTATATVFSSSRFLNVSKSNLVIYKDTNLPYTGIVFTPTIGGGQITNVAISIPATNNYVPPAGNLLDTYITNALTVTGGAPTTPASLSLQPASPITSVTIINGGTNYPAGTTVTFPVPTAIGGVQATGTPVIRNGVIVDIIITNPGSGYTAAYGNLTISGLGGSSAVARWSALAAVPFSVNIVNPGAGYTSIPTVSIAATANADFAALELRNSLPTNAGSNSQLLKIVGNTLSSVATTDITNYGPGSGSMIRILGGGTGYDCTAIAGTGIGFRVAGAGTGLSISNHSGNAITTTTSSSTRSLNIENTATTFASDLSQYTMSGNPIASTTIVQQMQLYKRANTTKNVVAPTIPNNSTDFSGVGSSVRFINPFYNIPRPDPGGVGGSFVGSITGSTLTVTSVTAPCVLAVSNRISYTGGNPSMYITALGSGSGGVGTYTINPPVASPVGPIAMNNNVETYADEAEAAKISGIWRNADYFNALGGLDIDLGNAILSNDPLRRQYPSNKVMRLRSDGRITFPQNLPEYANETAATTAGLISGDLYRVAGPGYKIVCIVA